MSTEEALSAEEVASKDFPVAFRGFGQHEVRAFLAQVAAELAAARERERLQRERLEAAESRAAARTPTEEEIEAALGQGAGKLLHAAGEAAAEIRAKAEEEAARLVAEATSKGARAHQEAESLLAERSQEAERLAAEILAEAEREAEAQVETAKAEGRAMVAEAQAVRERILKDLVRRRRVAHQHLEQLRAGRERLLEAYRVVRSTLDDATRELSVAEVEARAAAETAALRAGARADPTIAEIESELSAARDAGLTLAGSAGGDRRAGLDGNSNGNGEAREAAPGGPALLDDGPAGGEGGHDDGDRAGAGAEPDDAAVAAGAAGRVDEAAAGPEPDRTGQAREGGWIFRPVEPSERFGEPAAPATADPVGTVSPGEVAEVLAEMVETVAEPATTAPDAAVPGTAAGEPGTAAAPPLTEEAVDPELVTEPVAEAATTTPEPAQPGPEPAPPEPPVVQPVAFTVPAEPAPEPDVPAAEVPEPDVPAVAEAPEPDVPGVSLGPAPAPPAASESPSPPASPESDVERLFARIRADRQAAVSRAQAVLSDQEGAPGEPEGPTPVEGERSNGHQRAGGVSSGSEIPAEPPPLDAPGVATPDAADDEHVLQERDAQIEPLERVLLRSLKRALADEQNEVLDTLRRQRGRCTLADLLPGPPDHVRRFLTVVSGDLEAAAIEGARSAGGGEPPPVDDLALALATEVAGDLRARFQRSLDAADGDEDPLRDAISSAYREWKTSWARPLVRHHVAAAHARGHFAAVPDVALRWVVDDDEGACPDCDDNALAGPTPKGAPFPTGQEHPPAHVGCRCMVVPEPA